MAEWALPPREALQRRWIGILLELVDMRIARQALPEAIDMLDRLLAADPANEAAVRRLMRLLAQLDRRGEALRVYHRLKATLHKHYGIEPLYETQELYSAVQKRT